MSVILYVVFINKLLHKRSTFQWRG